ncbi:MAG: hypothetical protein L3J52_08435, partial [Proteobacteria bacterium]|nr:hypothetical protein [Pseudomonadota bacterium]
MKIFRTLIMYLILLQPVMALSEEEMHTLNLQDTDIRLLVETISDITGKNFVIDPEVDAKITVISGHPVAKDKIYDLFLSILSVNGFTTESQGSTIKIIPIAKSNPLSGLNGSHPDQLMTKIFRIKHVPVGDVEQMLKTMAGNKVKIISNKDSNILIVSDKSANIKKIDALIKNIDQKSDTSIELIALQHASAQDVADTLSQLLESTNTLGPQSKIVPDHRTNSVIINANPAIKARIMSIIAKLDVPLETNTQAQVIYLKYASAETLVPILETLANKNQKEDDQLQTSIQAHLETNSLVINATPAVYNNILNAIERLDIKRRQVLIEAIIADVTIDNSREIGVDWFAPLAGDGSSGIVGGSFTGNSLPNLDDSGTGPLDIFGGLVSGGLNLGYLNFGTNSNGDSVLNFGGLLKAISENGNNNIMSTPSLV